jgi:hypothetical protein
VYMRRESGCPSGTQRFVHSETGPDLKQGHRRNHSSPENRNVFCLARALGKQSSHNDIVAYTYSFLVNDFVGRQHRDRNKRAFGVIREGERQDGHIRPFIVVIPPFVFDLPIFDGASR